MKNYKKLILTMIILTAIALGIFLFQKDFLQYIPFIPTSKELDRVYAERVDPASVIEVGRGNIKKTVSTSGYIRPENEAYLSFATTGTTGGTVESIFIQRGDLVERGQELVKLEDKQEHLNYLKAKNEYELAKITSSPSQIEETKLNMEVALDKYESKTLKAPFSGKIVDIFVEAGDFIEGTSDVIYLIDDTSYEVEVSVSEVDCLSVRVGQIVEIELDIFKGEVFSGIVAEVAEYARVESGVVTVPVILRMDEVFPYFKPGFSATAEIVVDLVEDVVIIPITSISTGKRGPMVLKVENDQAIPTPIQIGINDGFYQEVSSGIESGDKIVINNYQTGTPSSGNREGFGGMGGSPIPIMRR